MLLAARSKPSIVLTVGKLACLPRSRGVAGVAGGDLDLDQRPQQLLRGPALGLGRHEHLGRDTTHRGELEPAQSVLQIGG
jgi:hypothetical protein